LTIVRVFDTAVDPESVPRGVEVFRTQVKPAIESFPGCQGIELLVGVEERSGDLVDVLAISRWDSLEQIRDATSSPAYEEALREMRELFQRTPIVRHFEAADNS
jgi:heme-degrading monooxygenase HmoA